MEPSGIEALWERSAALLPDPEAGQVDRARSRIIALAGLYWMEKAAQVRLEPGSGPRGLHHFSRRYLGKLPLFPGLSICEAVIVNVAACERYDRVLNGVLCRLEIKTILCRLR